MSTFNGAVLPEPSDTTREREELRFIVSYLAHNDQDANHAWMVRRIRAVLAGTDPGTVEPWSQYDGVRQRVAPSSSDSKPNNLEPAADKKAQPPDSSHKASEAKPSPYVAGGCGCVCSECLHHGLRAHLVCIYKCKLETRATVLGRESPRRTSSMVQNVSTESKPDDLAGDPGKWSCKCGRRISACPCFADGFEHGVAYEDPAPIDAPASAPNACADGRHRPDATALGWCDDCMKDLAPLLRYEFDKRDEEETDRPSQASADCPVCSLDTPHAHSKEDIEQWATNQVARWGYVTRIMSPGEAAYEREDEAVVPMLVATLQDAQQANAACPLCDSQSGCLEDCPIERVLTRCRNQRPTTDESVMAIRAIERAAHDRLREASADSSGQATAARVKQGECLCIITMNCPDHDVPAELAPLAARIFKGRAKYPTGCTLLSLLDEAGEVAHAVNKRESNERVRDELLDVAAVAMRLYFGEIDTAWRPDFGAADGSSAAGNEQKGKDR